MKDWTEKAIERAENVVYLVVAVILVLIAAVVLVRAVLEFLTLGSAEVSDVAAKVLDLLLLVFIVVELLFAVRTTLSRRELVAEPFILVGIIASLKEIVVLSVKAPELLGTPEFAGHDLAHCASSPRRSSSCRPPGTCCAARSASRPRATATRTAGRT